MDGRNRLVMAVAGLVGAVLWLFIHPERPRIPSAEQGDVAAAVPADVASPTT